MCVCGEEFANKAEVDAHMLNEHTNPKTWKCSHCGLICKSKGHCWGHVRKHQNRYFHYCDVKYTDPNKLDEDGNPKVVICDVTSDEKHFMLYHWETVHKKGRTPVRCSNKQCDKPQSSVCRKKDHELVCKKGQGADGEAMHFCQAEGCAYTCRGRDTLNTHTRGHHPELVGLTEPKRWTCEKCKKEYMSPSGLRTHICKKDKKPKNKPGTSSGD